MDEEDSISITLTKDEWRTIQTALDSHFSEVEHASDTGLTRAKRHQRADERQARMKVLEAIDSKIGEATGDGPVFA
jgi:hypothetical protein